MISGVSRIVIRWIEVSPPDGTPLLVLSAEDHEGTRYALGQWD